MKVVISKSGLYVRELKNIVERLVVLSDRGVVRAEDMPDMRGTLTSGHDSEGIKTLKEFRSEVESGYIQEILKVCNYNMTETAKKLGISRRQLFNKLTEYGLR